MTAIVPQPLCHRAETVIEGDFVVVAVPLKRVNSTPAQELAGKAVLDINMAWSDGLYAGVESDESSEHKLHQQQSVAYVGHSPTSRRRAS